MPDQVKGGFVLVVYNIKNFILHFFVNIFVARPVYGLTLVQACQFHGFLHPQAVKFQPGIFPGKFPVGDIGADLVGKQQKSLAAFDLVSYVCPPAIVRNELSGAGETQMEEIMVPGRGTEGMRRVALFPAKLV